MFPFNSRAHSKRSKPYQPRFEVLESRYTLTAPAAPLIIEPLVDQQVVSRFDVHMEVDANAYFDADGDTHNATTWQIRETAANGGATVWQALNVTDPLSKVHIHQGDGQFVGTLSGQSALLPNREYNLRATFTDSRGETSSTNVRAFRTADDTQPVPGAGVWIATEGYRVELAATADAFRLPVNIAFVPNPGTAPDSPYYYVAELYGSIKVVTRNGQVSNYATGLLDYNPNGPFSGSGEQGLTGLAVDPATGDLFVGMLWNNGTTDAQRGGATLHYPKVERLHSNDGGRTMATRSIILNMQPETQGQSHQISNITIGPDNKLYVHMGDAFVTNTALNLNQYRGKILRMNLNGTAPNDNPFYSAADGITPRDYVYTYGHRNPFGGAWRAVDGVHYVVENGNSLDRLVGVASGQSYGWAGDDSALVQYSNFIWDPANAPINITFVQPQTFGGSLFPPASQSDAFVTLSGPTYGSGPQANGKRIVQFPNLDARDANSKITTQPVTLVQYNGTGRATVAALAAGPDGLYFSDLYRDDGAGGPTAVGANVYRVRYVDFHPSNLTATSGNARVTLNWTANSLAASYNVYRKIEDGAAVLVAANVIGNSFIDTSVTNGTHYHYFVRGVNTGGESEDSNEVHAEPIAPVGQPPTVATPASATPNPVVTTTTNLSVRGSDDQGESNLTYTWALSGTPPNPVTFSVNGTNAAKNTTAAFSGAGAYNFTVTIRDTSGQTVTSSVAVTVNQTLASVSVSPSSATVAINTTRQFTATALDQFSRPMATQPAFNWSINAGGVGTINSSGLYTAPAVAGNATIRATVGFFDGTATVAVSANPVAQGLNAVYFNNANLTGTSIVRNDAAVSFDFGSGSPSSFIAADTFSARWIGAIEPRFTETYTFITTSDDGVRLWVNNQLIIDQWNDHAATEHFGTITLVADQRYDIRLEYYEAGGEAVIKLEWQSASQPRGIVPPSKLFSTVPTKINFQPSGAAVPTGYLVDSGAAFANRGNGQSYGWNGNNATSVDRNSTRSPDQRYDTLLQMQNAALPNAAWEIAVPNGAYRVHVVSGDATSTNSVFRVNVEGVLTVSGTPTTSQRWIEGWADVTVSDGRLTISNGTGASNNKINFVDFIPLAIVVAPPNSPPTVATPARATPNSVTGTTTALSVLGADDLGESNLTYTWALVGTPPSSVTFSLNGTNAAKNTIATFTGAGTYNFSVTIRDSSGQTAVSNVAVTVNQTLTSISVSPPNTSVTVNNTRQFTASALDQFNSPLTSQPTFTWSVDAGGVGTINASGLYQAPTAAGNATVRATSGTISGTATVAVTAVPAVQTQPGLNAVYFNAADLTGTSILRTDATVNFDFASGSPDAFIAADTFSARWIGAIESRYSQTYTFITTSDDGVRLWVNNQLIIDQWNDHATTEHFGTIALVAGQRYDIRLEYYEAGGEAVIKLEWQSASQAREVVPQSQLFSTVSTRINFQPAIAPVPAGYIVDSGAAFGDRGNGNSYGWNGDKTSHAADRNSTNSPDQRYDTLMQMQGSAMPDAAWEIAVPNGAYRVHVVSGDAININNIYKLNVEGVLAVNGTPTTSQRWVEGWTEVTVTDGRLTITNALGSNNNNINFVDIIPLATPTAPPPIPTGLDFSAGFAGATGLTQNGSAAIAGTALRLTNGAINQAASTFSTARQEITRFNSQFDFRPTNAEADGFTFAIQGVSASALGDSGGGLGYGPDPNGGTAAIGNSVAVKFDLYDNQGEGDNSTGLFLNGASPSVGGVAPVSGSTSLTTAGIDLRSGHVFRANIGYDGTRLTVTITDLTTSATATQTYDINLVAVLGASNAFVGFTAGTGGLSATFDILNWRYVPL